MAHSTVHNRERKAGIIVKLFLIVLALLGSVSLSASELYCVASHPDASSKFYSSGTSSVPVETAIEVCRSWAKETENEPSQCKLEYCDQFVDVATNHRT